MNKFLLSAAILSFVTLLIHVIAGGQDVHVPFLESALTVENKAIFSVIWHAVTAVLLTSSVALFFASKNHTYRLPIAMFVSAQFSAFALLFVFYGLSRLGTLFLMPQWIIFLTLTSLTLIGLVGRGEVRT